MRLELIKEHNHGTPPHGGARKGHEDRPLRSKVNSTILVPYDFSSAADWALDHALSHASLVGSDVHIIHVLGRMYAEGFLEKHQRDSWKSYKRKDAEEKLKVLIASKGHHELSITFEIRNGLPEYEILKAATAADASLIVMGRNSRGVLSRMIFGSLTEDILQNAPCPVLIVSTESG